MSPFPPRLRPGPAGLLVALALGGFLAGEAAAQAGSARAPGVADSATFEAASALVAARRFREAAELLERVVAREPDNARGWALLGYAHHSAGDLERALEAHLRAAGFEETAPTAMYNAGLAFALQGRPDEAFRWLSRAKETGRVDMTALAADPDAESLRDDPRYGALFPSAEELADPFVEPVRVIREWRGEAAGDQFGWIARDAGDVDGDGVRDVVTSAPTHAGGAGKVYVYSSATGGLLWSRAGGEGESLGLGVESAGDVDADGVPDVAAGAPGADRVYLLSGRDGSVLRTLEGAEGEAFGRRAAGVGDVDGDGHGDVLVGAPSADGGGEDAGAVRLFSGRDGRLMLEVRGDSAGHSLGSSVGGATVGGRTRLLGGSPGAPGGGRVTAWRGDGSEDFRVEPDETGFFLGGMFTSVVGDVDADGVPDVYASDWGNTALGRSTGRIYVHSGADGRRLLTLTGEAAGDGFGIGTAEAGDVDGDGHDDLVVGAWRHSGAAPSGGKVYVFSGRDGAVLRTVTGKVPGETLGFDATGLGDVDGDGALDFLVTSAWSSVEGGRSGRVWVISGRPAG